MSVNIARLLRLTHDKQETFLKILILALAAVVSFSSRLFAVIRFESVIHEFDPYFNYRTTRYLTDEGYYNFHNWFDDRAWYPLGRIIGGTIYPGLMITSALIHRMLHVIHFTLHVREICVFLAPLFSSFTVLITYMLTRELKDDAAGLVAASMIAIVPGYISRSVAGSYDNEGIAIFCMLSTYYLWIKAVKSGNVCWSVLCSLGYFYMVSSWGVLHYWDYTVNANPFVGFQPVQTSEHMMAFGVFGLCQIIAFAKWLRARMSEGIFNFFFEIAPWTGRFYSLLDPSYAKNNIPIIASVSEHQPTAWSSFYFDLQILMFTFPVGLYVCFKELNDHNIFIILYALTSIYFAGVMVRLMLVLAPVMCILGGIALSSTLSTFMKNLDSTFVAQAVIAIVALFFISYVYHCTWAISEAYSSPSIVLSAHGGDGSTIIFDDFREAYYWLRKIRIQSSSETFQEAKVMSWWDYGYQITAMANRTVIVDNNTWNNTHISRVGQAMSSKEEDAYEIMRELDVDYVLVILVEIGGSTPEGAHIKEIDYFSKSGEFRVDREGSPTMLNCLMYKLCYYRFGGLYTLHGQVTGFDRVRHAEIGNKDFELDFLEEAYTTEHWIVKPLDNRGHK
ncbi:Dolichyl-diphosphooligosaccharide--protein glycosyltransferase subunit STT3 [Dirofilaria immitis]|nr:Dolichyl-diphosphooligosaccharide--protein glycosyltransferase subunit STT3 [Dirofilaria immitis]